MSKSHKDQSDKIRAAIKDYIENKDVSQETSEMHPDTIENTTLFEENEKLQSRLETCGNHLIQVEEQYQILSNAKDKQFLELSQMLLDFEDMKISYSAQTEKEVQLRFEIQDNLATIKSLSGYRKTVLELQEKLEQEKDFRELAVSGLEKYVSKLGDQKDSYRRLILILLCFLLAFGLGFFILLIQRL